MTNLKEFKEKGYLIIDNFLEITDYSIMFEKFSQNKNWERVDQERDHYQQGGPFEMESQYFPNHDEKYFLQGWRAKELELDVEWRSVFKSLFLEKIEKIFGRNIIVDTTYILKYMKNDFSRIHVDDLRGEVERVDISILYYLCDQWVWDWGGILMLAQSTNSENMHAILPKKNRIIFLNNQKKLPHCVTKITDFAKNDRYTVASFLGCDQPF